MMRDRAVVEVSREIVEAKEWLKALLETGSQFKFTQGFLSTALGLKGKVLQSRDGVCLLGP